MEPGDPQNKDSFEREMEILNNFRIRLGEVTDDDIAKFRAELKEDKISIFDQKYSRDDQARFVVADRLSLEERKIVSESKDLGVKHRLRSLFHTLSIIKKNDGG